MCFPQWPTWITRVCYKHYISCYPFRSYRYTFAHACACLGSQYLFLPCQAPSAFWASCPLLCSYHSLCIYLFQHCCTVLTWNILHFIPYKPVYFLKQLFHFIYSSAKNYAWYRTDVQYMFVEVNCSKALFSHLMAMWSRHVTFIFPASVI